MPIDTSWLGTMKFQQPDFAGSIEKGMNLRALSMKPELIQAQIEASKASTEATKAGTPGIAAKSAQDQYAADALKFQRENTDKWMDADPKNPEGPGVLNIDKFVREHAKAGFLDVAQGAAAKDIANKAGVIKNAGEARTTLEAARAHLTNITQNISDPVAAKALWDKGRDYVNSLIPGAAEQLGDYNPTVAKGVLAATMTPLEQANLKLSQGNLEVARGQLKNATEATRQAGEASGTGPSYSDPNSPVSNATRNILRSAGISVPDGLSHSAMMKEPQWKAIVEGGVVTPEVKAAAITKSAEHENRAKAYDNISAIAQRLMSRGLMQPSNKVSSFITDNKNRLSNDPDFLALQAATSQVPDLDWQGKDGKGLSAQAKQLADTQREFAKTQLGLSQMKTFGGAPAAEPAPAPAAVKPAPAPAAASGKMDIKGERAKANSAIARGADVGKVREHFKKATGQEL